MIKTRSSSRSRVPVWLRILIPSVLILVWLALFAAGGSSFSKISEVAKNDQVQQLPASADATQVQELQSLFRGDDVIPAVLVYQRDSGLTADDDAEIAAQVSAIQDVDGVVPASVSPPIISEDGEAAQVIVPMDTSITPADTVETVRDYLADNQIDGVSAYVTGPAGLSADIVGAFAGLDGILLLTALAAVLVILIIVYRSPLMPLIVLGTSLSALCAAVLVVISLARADVLVLSGQTQGILFILVIGAATDYSLLYVSRYREALRDHERKWDATMAALRGSFEPILASGGTVIVALLCLLFSDLNSNKALGPVAAIGIAFALLASLTLLPALMLWAGRVAFWPVRPAFGSAHPELTGAGAKGVWPKIARLVGRRARLVWIASTLLLAVASIGLFQLKADGVPQSDFVLGSSQARDGQAVLGDHFPGGAGTPALVVGPESELDAMAEVILAANGVDSLSVLSEDSPSGTLTVTDAGLSSVGPPGTPVGEPTVHDGQVMLQATLDDAGDSAEADANVRHLRVDLADLDNGILVGGTTAIAIDTHDTAVHDRNLIIPIILGVILIILMLLLRSVLAPVLLVATVVLSFGAALGVSAWVFNGVFGFSGADPSVPMFGFVFLVALGIDYNIFLMTRVREESIAHGTREGILRGLVATGGVITSAGIVLAATFAALGVLPILFLLQISFIVAFGVLLDTFLVRSLLVPALAHDIGPKVWWPSKLARGMIRR
ncbi:MMPL family transporter [Glaciibacter superstes]|uniref:MMPL family transporter n=1 Tax=Glaciibacter superstes TaxID=501023 RepID=UPI0003B7230D|nr:MMPL family transporter [Glaciibacter superstes]